jgi:hypothetical protein
VACPEVPRLPLHRWPSLDRAPATGRFARSNIFGAGIDELPAPAGGGGGVTPACIVVADDVSHIRVTRVTGSISFVGPWFNRGGVAHKCAAGAEVGNPNSGPDGVWTATTCGWEPDGGTIDAAGVVSSITSTDRVGYLVGVFLPASAPGARHRPVSHSTGPMTS